MADRNGSDVVVEKFASASMPRSQRLFERSVERTTLTETPALVDSSLGPAKLYRRTFLLANAIRFPEGWRQMEDQAFTIHAYARAGSIAVCADRPCYFFNRREDGGHLTAERIEPDRHVRNLRTLLDLVDVETAPGPLRDRIIRRMLRVEVLNRVSEPAYLELTDKERAHLFAAARDLVRERIDQRVVNDLGPVRRLRCELLRDDRPADLLSLARQMADLELTATVDRIDWDDGALHLSMTAGLAFRSSGQPLRFAQPDRGSGPGSSTAGARVGDPYEVSGDPGLIRAQLVLRSRPSVLEWYVGAVARPSTDRVRATATARIDPLHLGAGSLPIDAGSWDIHIRMTGLGIEWSAPLRWPAPSAGSAAATSVTPPPIRATSEGTAFVAACPPALLGDPARVVAAVADPGGIRLEVDPTAAVIASVLRSGPIRVLGDGAHLVIALPMVSGPGAAPLPAALVIGPADGDRVLPARLRPLRHGVVLDVPNLAVDADTGRAAPAHSAARHGWGRGRRATRFGRRRWGWPSSGRGAGACLDRRAGRRHRRLGCGSGSVTRRASRPQSGLSDPADRSSGQAIDRASPLSRGAGRTAGAAVRDGAAPCG